MSLIVDITAHPARLSSIPYATLYRVLAVLLVLIAAALTWSHFGNLDPLALTPVARTVVGVIAGVGIGVVAALMGVGGGELLILTIVLR